MAVQKVDVNGVVYDIEDKEGVKANSQRLDETLSIVNNSIDGNDISFYGEKDKVVMEYSQNSGNVATANIPSATSTEAGVMSATDKQKVDNIEKYVSSEVAKIIEGTDPNTIDSIKDLVEWVEQHGDDAAQMVEAIEENASNIENLKNNALHKNLSVELSEAGVVIQGHSLASNITKNIASIPAATNEKAGVMRAEDKQLLENSVDGNDISFYGDKDKVVMEYSQNSGNVATAYIPAATSTEAGVMSAEDKREQVKKTALINGDTIVGLAREVYSRQGKEDKATFLSRTTAGGTTVSDGVASIKQIGGNIVKNLLDISTATYSIGNGTYVYKTLGIVTMTANPTNLVFKNVVRVDNHIYYGRVILYNESSESINISLNNGLKPLESIKNKGWVCQSVRGTKGDGINVSIRFSSGSIAYIKDFIVVDLTEMYGAGKEPTKEECDRMFGTMDALPQGLIVAQPTALKSIGYNHWNPANLIANKCIVDGSVVDNNGTSIAIIECLPCKTGTGENNGYVIGYGEGDGWSDEGIEVYLTPLNPLEVEGELYLQKLEKDATYNTYVPGIKGYLLIVTPETDKLCAHLHWSGDRATTDYEPYVESVVSLPQIPQMSEWGLAGISSSGTMVQDTIDLEKMVYTKRIGCVDMATFLWSKSIVELDSGGESYNVFTSTTIDSTIKPSVYGYNGNAIMASFVNTPALAYKSFMPDMSLKLYTNGMIYVRCDSCADITSLKSFLAGKMLYYELAEAEEYPIVTKTAPNYIGSDYGIEQFIGSRIPLVANILFYMRSLVSETRNFLDRLMARLGTSDATAMADKIADAILSATEVTEVEPTEVIEE